MRAETLLPLLVLTLQLLSWLALGALVFAPNGTVATWAGRGLSAAVAALGFALMLAMWHQAPCALPAGLTLGIAVVVAAANSGRAVEFAAA